MGNYIVNVANHLEKIDNVLFVDASFTKSKVLIPHIVFKFAFLPIQYIMSQIPFPSKPRTNFL